MITGISEVEELRLAVEEGHTRLVEERCPNSRFEQSLLSLMNLEKLDTIK